MDSLRRNIQLLTAELDEKRERLSAYYRQFGERLMRDSADGAGGAVPAERVSGWKELMRQREADAQTMLDIKSAVTRQQELSNFRRELERTLAEETDQLDERYARMGKLFFDHYDPERDAELFGEAWASASSVRESIERAEVKKAAAREDLSRSALFAKLPIYFRLWGLSSNIRARQEQFGKILTEGARRVVDSGEFARSVDEGRYGPELSSTYSGVRESLERLNGIKQRAGSVDSDFSAVEESLSARGAGGKPGKRVESLRLSIRDFDRRIDAQTAQVAREYADKFLDEEGRSLLGDASDGNSFSDMGAYARQLELVAQYRAETAAVRRRIEIMELSVKIESVDRADAAARRSIAENDRKIARLQEQNEAARRAVENGATERSLLVAQRDELHASVAGEASTVSPGE